MILTGRITSGNANMEAPHHAQIQVKLPRGIPVQAHELVPSGPTFPENITEIRLFKLFRQKRQRLHKLRPLTEEINYSVLVVSDCA